MKRGFRGDRAQFVADFECLAPQVPAKQTGDCLAEVHKLSDMARFVVVGTDDLRKKGFLGIGRKSLRDTLAGRLRESMLILGQHFLAPGDRQAAQFELQALEAP